MTRILIVEDDLNMSALLTTYLERDGFAAVSCPDGVEALRIVRADPPGLILLDIMLQELDGWEVCRQLRRTSSIPIIMLTARVDEADRIAGLRLGADDYVVKPFSPAEVVERVKAVLRRTNANYANASELMLRHGEMLLSSERYTLSISGKPVALTLSEFRIVEAMMRAPGRVFTREQLLDVIHDEGGDVIDRAVDVHIVNLRRKLEVQGRRVIETVRGIGYRFRQGEA